MTDFNLTRGYRTALLGRVTAMHARYYGEKHGFGLAFEAGVAAGMAEFLPRAANPSNEIWAAMRDDRIIGSVSIDGEDIGRGVAHLRWFIVEDRARGCGVGRALLETAMRFVDGFGFRETHLWTFSGLDPARRLYEDAGFRLIHEAAGDQWGSTVKEQKFVRRPP